MEDEVEDDSVSKATLRHLRTTFPFDSKKAVSFVSGGRQGGLRTVFSDGGTTEDTGNSETFDGKLTGKEAKDFYEEVLSLPEKKLDVGMPLPAVGTRHLKRNQPINRRKDRSVQPRPVTQIQLFKYVQNNELEQLQTALLENHFDVDILDDFHWTMLMVAAHAGHMTIVELLLDMGARWRGFTYQGMTAADLARTRGHQEIADLIENSAGEETSLLSPPSKQLTRKRLRDPDTESTSRTFYCKACKTAVSSCHEDTHDTSIVHLYNDQHGIPSTTSYGIPETNRGFQMLLRSGWDREKGLGPQKEGHKFPVKTVLKQDRLGLGLGEGKARVTHFSAHDRKAVYSHRDRHNKTKPSKKKDILQEKNKDSQWERRLRTLMNIEDSHLLT